MKETVPYVPRHPYEYDVRKDSAEYMWQMASRELDRIQADARMIEVIKWTREGGRGIVNVPGIPSRPVATVGYDDPTGDDVAADAPSSMWRGTK